MSCKLNLKATNGKDSILFKDIMTTVADPSEAVDIYYFTKSSEFKRAYGDYTAPGYTGPALDSNNEPRFDTFSKEKYIGDKEYAKIEADNKATVYKTLIETVPRIQAMLANRIDYMTGAKGANVRNLKNLKDLQSLLQNGPLNQSLPKFLNMANAHVFYLREQAERILRNPDAKFEELASVYKVSQGYDIIQELRTELLSDEDIKDMFDEDLMPINNTVGDINAIRSMYMEKAKLAVAKEFSRRDSGWSRADIIKALNHSPKDSTYLEQVLKYAGDSKDEVVSMAAEIIMSAEHKIRKESIEFNRELQEVLEPLEKSGLNSNEIFSQLITQRENGELHILDIDAENTNGVIPFMDEQYRKVQAIKANKPLYDFFRFFSEDYKRSQAMLVGAPIMGTRIPTVLMSEFERTSGKTLTETTTRITDSIKKGILRSNLDTEKGMILDSTGKPVKRIPTFYTQKYDSIDYEKFYDKMLIENTSKGMEDTAAINDAHKRAEAAAIKKTAQFISKDLAHSLQSFHAMALNFSAKNEVLPILEAVQDIVGSEYRTYGSVDSAGKAIIDRGTGRAKTITGLTSNSAAALNTLMEMQMYGQKEKDLGFTDLFGVKIDNNAALRKVGNFTSMISVGGNVLSGITNVGNGEYNNILEAVGGEYYNVSDFHKASGMYKQNLGGILGDIGSRTPTNIVNMLEEHYNILQSYESDIATTERTKFKRLFNTSAMFALNNAGEHFMQVRAGLAVLEHTKAFDKSGKELGSLLSLHKKVNGKLVVPTDVYVIGRDGNLTTYNDAEQNIISNRIGAIIRKSQGNYSTHTRTLMKQDGRLALVIKFREWMVEGIDKRYGTTGKNRMLGKEFEGFYRTGGRVGKELLNDLRKLQFDIAKDKWQHLTPTEKANIRRLIMETGSVLTMAAVAALLSNAGKVLDDKYGSDSLSDKLILGSYLTLIYTANRLTTEMASYANPMEAIRLLRTPVASVSVVESMANFVGQLVYDPFAEYETGWRKGQNKTLVDLGKLVPLYKQMESFNPDGIKEKTRYYQ